ncbi:hypothetical protein [Aquimarina aquimarini]|uniref:hypothetical protein n=1 Tax=Aquimarina aquimarini TaxID=1191734 RepID=UPI000D54B672|nr:hypothetical protein [Aquimarina aquimarini]
MINLKRDTNISIAFFLLAAMLGVFLRFLYVFDISVNYKYIVHAHSHIALLGWVYVAIITIFYRLYLDQCGAEKYYRIIFWCTQVTLVGMLLSFPFQGYALFSIIFSTLFLFTSYWYVWFFIKNIPSSYKTTKSYKCIKTALWYMVVSSVGPWALGAIMNTLGAGSVWYKLAIYFYLHFQYNGWMILALFGAMFYVLEKQNLKISNKNFNRFFIGINISIVLTFFLSILWTEPSGFYYFLAGIGCLFQVLAFILFIKIMLDSGLIANKILSKLQLQIIQTVVVLMTVKIVLQLLSSIPYFANLATTILDFTIGYLHWTFLGVISVGLFFFLEYFSLIKIPKKGYYIYMLGFVLTELFIFYKGMIVWLDLSFFLEYFLLLSIASVIIFIGILYCFLFNIKWCK